MLSRSCARPKRRWVSFTTSMATSRVSSPPRIFLKQSPASSAPIGGMRNRKPFLATMAHGCSPDRCLLTKWRISWASRYQPSASITRWPALCLRICAACPRPAKPLRFRAGGLRWLISTAAVSTRCWRFDRRCRGGRYEALDGIGRSDEQFQLQDPFDLAAVGRSGRVSTSRVARRKPSRSRAAPQKRRSEQALLAHSGKVGLRTRTSLGYPEAQEGLLRRFILRARRKDGADGRSEPGGQRVGKSPPGRDPHPSHISVWPYQHGGGRGDRAKYGKLPRTGIPGIDKPDPTGPRRNLEITGLTEVDQHGPGLVQQGEGSQRAGDGDQVEVGHSAPKQWV